MAQHERAVTRLLANINALLKQIRSCCIWKAFEEAYPAATTILADFLIGFCLAEEASYCC